MNFYPHSAFQIPKRENGLINKEKKTLAEFWDDVDSQAEEAISCAIGCYIFSIRAGGGTLPWYVGMAEKQSFRKECFTNHKLVHYNEAIAARIGTPLLTLVPKYTRAGKLVNPTGNEHKDIQFLESLLISKCISRNPSLSNAKDTKFLREMVVPGLLNTPKGGLSDTVSDFKNIIGN